jgi:ferric-dicitrate binding protein FerR (iron transport regulator)
MSDERDSQQPSERTLQQLFAHAQPRQVPPTIDAEEIRRAVLAEWNAVTGRRQWRRRAAFAAAASVLLAAGVWVGAGMRPSPSPVSVARVERIQGIVGDESGSTLAVGSVLAAGATLTTRTGQVALRLASGGSLRIGPRSEIVLTSANSAELVGGLLYFDSERQRPGAEFSVTTTVGTVRDVGTQFIVRLDGERTGLEVGVRDGRITLTTGGATDTAESGERLVAARNAPAIRREPIPTFGGDWEWTETLAPPFDIDGRTVREFLAWFADQTGRSVVFGSAGAERLARETRLRGSIDLDPLRKLSAVMALTDLTYALEGENVVINTR